MLPLYEIFIKPDISLQRTNVFDFLNETESHANFRLVQVETLFKRKTKKTANCYNYKSNFVS